MSFLFISPRSYIIASAYAHPIMT